MYNYERQRLHDEQIRSMDAQTNVLSAQALAIEKQNKLLEKEYERQIEKEYKDKIFQLQLHLAQATDDTQRYHLKELLAEAEEAYASYQLEQEEQRLRLAKQQRIWGTVLSIAMLLCLIGAYFLYNDASHVSVPKLHGVELSEAKDALYEKGLKVGMITEVADQTVEAGYVSLSIPSGGRKIKRGDTVDLVVARATELSEQRDTSDDAERVVVKSNQSSDKSQFSNSFQPFLVNIKKEGIKIRQSPSLSANDISDIVPGTYTIVETSYHDGYSWGKLKSGLGWIMLSEIDKVVSEVDTKNLTEEQVKKWVIADFLRTGTNSEKYIAADLIVAVQLEKDGLVYARITIPNSSQFNSEESGYYRINEMGQLERRQFDSNDERKTVVWELASDKYME